MATIDKFIDDILKKEGGFQNSSSDNGNWTNGKTGKGKLVGTNLGVTAPVLAKWRGVKADSITEADIKGITPEEARAIYEKKYYIDTKINLLPPDIQGNVLDMAINSGASRAIKLLQKAAGVDADGVLGPKSIAAAARVDNNTYVDARNEFYTGLVKQNPEKYNKFQKGWLNRSNSFRVDSDKLPPTGAGAGRGFVNPEFNAQAGYDTIPISDAPYPEVSRRYGMELLSKPNVNSPDGVKRVQAQIGADVDGIWGKQSQDLFDMHNRQAYDNKVRPPSDTYRQEGFQRQAPRKTSLLERGVNAIIPSAQAAEMPVAPPEKQYATMEDLLIDKDLMQNPMLFNDEDAKRMWATF